MTDDVLWDWDYVVEILPVLAEASVVTAKATLLGFGLALAIGLVLAVGRIFGPPWLRPGAGAIVEFVRSTPLLVQLFFLYYVMPQFGVTLDAMLTGVLALGLHYGAYCSEVYRAGFAGVPRGQWEAALALNLSPWTTLRRIIVPQAIPPVVPALGNYLIALFKETPLLSVIAVLELMQTAKLLGSESFRYTEPITLAGGMFLAFSLVAAAGVRLLERRLQHAWGRTR
jgi:polar amino acid transport system permease protein